MQHEQVDDDCLQVRVEVVVPGALDDWTGIHELPKPKRFRDES